MADDAVKELTNVLNVDYMDIGRRIVSAIIEGLVVIIVALYLVKRKSIPLNKNDIMESILLGLVAASVFAILDLMTPTIADGASKGSGFTIGANVAGGL